MKIVFIFIFIFIAACGNNSKSDDVYQSARNICVEVTNNYRDSLNIAPLIHFEEKNGCTDGEAKSDSTTKTAHGAFGSCGESAQNECPDWPADPEKSVEECLAMMFDEGPGSDYSKHGHYINMTNKNYTKVSCGFYETEDGSLWIVQNFW